MMKIEVTIKELKDLCTGLSAELTYGMITNHFFYTEEDIERIKSLKKRLNKIREELSEIKKNV